MKIVARIKNIDEIKHFDGLQVDVFSLDGEHTSKKIADFSLEQIGSAVNIAHEIGKQVFVNVNKMVHEPDLENIENYLSALKNSDIDGIVINDMTVYVIAKKLDMENKIIYQPGTHNTDSYSAEYFSENRVLSVTLSHEITLAEIVRIAATKPHVGLSLVGHGYLDMFYSKRKLLRNYFLHKGLVKADILDNQGFRLNEEMRGDQYYPIIEDNWGTHIFRSRKLISIDEMDVLSKFIDYFFIERIFLADKEYDDAIRLYVGSLDKDEFLGRYPDYDSGFYYQRTEKLKGELNES